MRHVAILSSSLVLGLASAACGGHIETAASGGTSPGEVDIACDIPSSVLGRHECDAYVEPTQDDADLVAQACTEYDMGTVVDACPTAGLLGTCTRPLGGPAGSYENLPQTTFFYSDGGSLQGAELLCAVSIHGTWSSH
jgi:hypothetical protein